MFHRDMKEIECTVTGTVQGVFYRDTAKQNALSLGVTGYIENMPDGSVHVVAQGSEDALEAFIEKLAHGSQAAEVSDVSVTWSTPENVHETFSVRY